MSGIEAYLDSRTRFMRADAALKDIAQALRAVATEIDRNPGTFSFSNTGKGLPMEALTGPSMDANDWKSPAQIMDLLAEYHASRDACLNAWTSIPADRQGGLQEPPAGVLTRMRRSGGSGYR